MARGHLHPYWFYLLGGEGEGGGGGEQNTLLDNRFLNMSDCLRTSSALLTSHHIVKTVVKKVKKTDLTDIFSTVKMSLAACGKRDYKVTNKGYAAKLAIKAKP